MSNNGEPLKAVGYLTTRYRLNEKHGITSSLGTSMSNHIPGMFAFSAVLTLRGGGKRDFLGGQHLMTTVLHTSPKQFLVAKLPGHLNRMLVLLVEMRRAVETT